MFWRNTLVGSATHYTVLHVLVLHDSSFAHFPVIRKQCCTFCCYTFCSVARVLGRRWRWGCVLHILVLNISSVLLGWWWRWGCLWWPRPPLWPGGGIWSAEEVDIRHPLLWSTSRNFDILNTRHDPFTALFRPYSEPKG